MNCNNASILINSGPSKENLDVLDKIGYSWLRLTQWIVANSGVINGILDDIRSIVTSGLDSFAADWYYPGKELSSEFCCHCRCSIRCLLFRYTLTKH